MNLHSETDVFLSQRTSKGLDYEAKMRGLAKLRQSRQPKHREMFKRLVEEVKTAIRDGRDDARTRGVAPNAVHANTFLSDMSIQYANDMYIGERLMPVVPVDKRSDQYAIYPKRDRLAFPSDDMSSRSKANELDETRTFDNYSVKDHGLKNFVSAETVENEDAIFDEMVDLIEALNDAMAFNREVKLASVLTTAANYSGNTVTLSGSSQWDSGAGGDPIKDIQNALANIWQGRGPTDLVGFCVLEVFNALARHPSILDLLKYNRTGIAQRSEVAQIFGLSDLLVGAARQDTANSGQTASYSRIWGKHFGVVRVAKRPGKRSAQFGATFRLKTDPMTFQWFDPDAGKAGGYFGKVGISEDYKVVAGDTGFLIASAIS